MFDDGNHDDGLAGDNIWGINVGPFSFYDVITASFVVTDNNSLSGGILVEQLALQFENQLIQNNTNSKLMTNSIRKYFRINAKLNQNWDSSSSIETDRPSRKGCRKCTSRAAR